MEMGGQDIVVLGGSAGAIPVVSAVLAALSADLPAAVFIVLHRLALGPNLLAGVLSRSAHLEMIEPADREPIRTGRIYLAPRDRHMVLDSDRVRIMLGAKENNSRPAVDPLFRSAARVFGNRVIGVIVSGALEDGTSGLQAIKRAGGIAVAQDPEEALFPSMPRSVVDRVALDYCVATAALGPLLVRLTRGHKDRALVRPFDGA